MAKKPEKFKQAGKYLKSASWGPPGFSAEFTNGETTKSVEAAHFFMKMQDKGASPDELRGYIQIGRMTDPDHDWEEIKRIADTFKDAAK